MLDSLDSPDLSTAPLAEELYDAIVNLTRRALSRTKVKALVNNCTLLIVPFKQTSGAPPLQVTHQGIGLLVLVNHSNIPEWRLELYDLKEQLARIGETFFQISGLPYLLLKRQRNETILGRRCEDHTWHFWSYPDTV